METSFTEKTNLFFIAIIPQEKVYNEVVEFKNDFANRFDSRKALKVMPHITLKTPFKLANSKTEQLVLWFNRLYINTVAFKIPLKDFGSFNNPLNPVIFIKPAITTALFVLQKEIVSSFTNSFPESIHAMDKKFNPHMTVAYRDLGKGYV